MSSTGAQTLVRKLWQFCNVLRDDGLSYPDYVEQLTYLLFIKMSAEQQGLDGIPEQISWNSFLPLDAGAMHRHYTDVLGELSRSEGLLGQIFAGSQNKIRDPAKLRLLVVELVNEINWTELSPDVKGDAYEGLLEKNARDTKSGAGQYFTPRPLIDAIVRCVDPRPTETVLDPACGTGGFLLAAHSYMVAEAGAEKKSASFARENSLRGVELVEEVARLAAMNLYLHGISGGAEGTLPIVRADSLAHMPTSLFDVILSNPPFGIKGSVTYGGADRRRNVDDGLEIRRPDFLVKSANKQLNFLQHIMVSLKPGGRAAVVIPDNVLFEAGSAVRVRKALVKDFDLHTMLRLPAGLFYASGLQANVLFFDKKAPDPDRQLWVYDLRSGNKFSMRGNPLDAADLVEFVELYRSADRRRRAMAVSNPRWQAYQIDSLLARSDVNLDLKWTWGVDDAVVGVSGLTRLNEIGEGIASDLRKALDSISAIANVRGRD